LIPPFFPRRGKRRIDGPDEESPINVLLRKDDEGKKTIRAARQPRREICRENEKEVSVVSSKTSIVGVKKKGRRRVGRGSVLGGTSAGGIGAS